MKHTILSLLFPLYVCLSSAQSVTGIYEYELDINNIKTTLDVTGSIGWGGSHLNYFYAPATGTVSPLLGTWLWLAGQDQYGVYRDLCPDWYLDKDEIMYGPHTDQLDLLPQNYIDTVYMKYNRVWRVTKEQIESHKLNFSNSNYEIPEAILNWPGNGDTTIGFDNMLAPFTDYNSNRIYEPALGDHPNIKGDVTVYAIYHDHHPELAPDETPVSDLEVHIMLYAYETSLSEVIANTIFANYRVINRGEWNYDEFYAGVFTDVDLGYYSDDYVGCDSSLDLMFVYNGDSVDGPSQLPNYGIQLPAFGCMPLTYGLHSFMYRDGDFTIISYPTNAQEKFYSMDARFREGTQMTYGGNGYDTSPDAIPTNYMFSSDPRDPEGWSEVTESNAPADRRWYGGTGPYTLYPGDELCIEFAYIFAQAEQPVDHISSVDLLKSYASGLKTLYPFLENEICSSYKTDTLPETEIPGFDEFTIYPNPASDVVYFYMQQPAQAVCFGELYDITGKVTGIYSFVNATENQLHSIDVSALSPGLYLLRLKVQGYEFSSKIVVR